MPVPKTRKPLTTKLRDEVANRRRLNLVLPCLLEKADDSYVRITTLRRLLGLCGVNPHSTYFTEVLAARFETYVETVRQGDHRVNTLPGVRLIEGGTDKARAKLAKAWAVLTAADGAVMGEEPTRIPDWHTRAEDYDHGARGTHVAVRLPHDWSDEAVASSDFSTPDRVAMTAANREAAGVYNATMEDYVWRRADWSQFPKLERQVLELHVVDGYYQNEIAKELGIVPAAAKRILQRHRARAGITPRGRQPK